MSRFTAASRAAALRRAHAKKLTIHQRMEIAQSEIFEIKEGPYEGTEAHRLEAYRQLALAYANATRTERALFGVQLARLLEELEGLDDV